MSLIERIKTDQVIARKMRWSARASILTTLIGEAEMIGKNAGNRSPSNDEVTLIIKKFVKNLDENLRLAEKNEDVDRYDLAEAEKSVLVDYLPKQLNEQELTDAINQFISEWPTSVSFGIGNILARLKLKYNSCYDGAMAAKLVKDIVGKSRIKLV